MSFLAAVARRGLPTLALGLAGALLATAAAPAARAQHCLQGTLADEFRAADAGLVREWIVQVPIDSGAWRLQRVVVGDGLVLAQCGDGGVHAIRASRSRPWLTFPGVENHPDFVFLLDARWAGGEPAGGDGTAPPKPEKDGNALRLTIERPDGFTLRHPDDSGSAAARRDIAALMLLAVPRNVYESLDEDKKPELGPSTPGVLSVAIDPAEINAGRLHVARYAVSIGGGELVAAPAHTPIGTVAWSRTIPAAAGHSWPPTIGERLVLVSSELAVHALDRDTGAIEWERPTGSLTAASAVQSGDWVYQPLRTNRLLRLPVNPRRTPAEEDRPAKPLPASDTKLDSTPRAPESLEPLSVEAGGGFESAPVPVDQHDVIWFTNNGLVALKRTAIGWSRPQLPDSVPPTWVSQESLSLAGPPVVRSGTVTIASRTGGVASIALKSTPTETDPGEPDATQPEELQRMRVTWLTTLPEVVASGPLVSADVVLVSLGPSGMTALSSRDGRALWRSDLVGTLVATAGGRAWLIDEVGRLTALDLATGSRRQSTCGGCLTLPVVNTDSERLILAAPSGIVVSLAPPPAFQPTARAVTAASGPGGSAPAGPAATLP